MFLEFITGCQNLAGRLIALSHAQLIELVVAGCEESAALKNRADALVAQAKPLPTWCVDEVLLSPDLLPVLMSTLGLPERRAAVVCSTWASAYAKHIGKFRFVLPTVQPVVIEELSTPHSMCMLPNGVLAVVSSGRGEFRFVAAHEATDACVATLTQCRRSILNKTGFHWPTSVALADDSLLVCDNDEDEGMLFKFSLGTPAMGEFGRRSNPERMVAQGGSGFHDIAVHQASQRAFAVNEASITIIDIATMTRISTIIALGSFITDEDSMLRCVAVLGDSVIVSHDNVLSVFDLDGNHLRFISGSFIRANALAAAHGHIYLTELHNEQEPFEGLDDPDDEPPDWAGEFHGRRIFVIDIESGQTVQTAPIQPDIRSVTRMMVHEKNIYLSGFYADTVSVMRLAGDVP